MNLLAPLLVNRPVRKTAPPANSFRVFSVQFNTGELSLFQQILDLEINKYRFDYIDNFCSMSFRIKELMWMDTLLREREIILLTSIELQWLLTYIDSRIRRMVTHQKSILRDVSLELLLQELKALEIILQDATVIVPLRLLL